MCKTQFAVSILISTLLVASIAAQEAQLMFPGSQKPITANPNELIAGANNDTQLLKEIEATTEELRRTTNTSEKETSRSKLTELVSKDFDARIDIHETRLDELRERVEAMQDGLNAKRSAKLGLIEKRVSQLESGKINATVLPIVFDTTESSFGRRSLVGNPFTEPANSVTPQRLSDLDEQLDAWLAAHWRAWKDLADEPSGTVTVSTIDAVRKKTLDKFPPMSDFLPSHIRKIGKAGLLQDGPARPAAIKRINEFKTDQSSEGAMAAYLMFELASEFPLHGYAKDETNEGRLVKRKKSLAHLLNHPQLESVLKADKELGLFSFLQLLPPEVLETHDDQLIKLKDLLIKHQQASVHMEYSACFDVVKIAANLKGRPLETFRTQLIEFGEKQLERLKLKEQIDNPDMHKHNIGSLEGQIKYLKTVKELGTLIGSQAPELKFLWSSDAAIESWDDTKGKVCVLYFSTPSCGPCVKAVPKLLQLQKEIAKHGQMEEMVNFIGISSQQGTVPLKGGVVDCKDDFKKECETTLKYIKENKISWPIVYTSESVYNASFGVRSVPHMVILDSEGVIQDIFNPYEEEVGNILKRIGAVVN